MSIGVGIIGGGIFAREEHLPAVEASKHLTFKAVYSRSAKSAKTLLEGGKTADVYSDDSGPGKGLDDLLARTDIHAVIIALPILNQPKYIRQALQAGKHVLSEKPIAENLKDGIELVQWYESQHDLKATWGVAENFRFMHSYDYARDQIAKLGKLLTFRCRGQAFIKGGKYFETEWRKTPAHQGGFLLDGGVHNIAVVRLLLGSEQITRLSAFTTQLQSYLPPKDTIEGTFKTKSGALGSISLSFGTTAKGTEYVFGCEKGAVTLSHETVKTVIDEKEETKTIPNERTGVPPEVRVWGEALAAGKPDKRQSPKEALADLELLDKLLRSGEQDGAPINCEHQAV